MYARRHLSALMAALTLSIISSNNTDARFERLGSMFSSLKKIRMPSISNLKKISMPRLSGFFGSYVYQEPFERDYALPSLGTLSISNIEGNITVQTGASSDTVLLQASKRANEQDTLANITLQESSAKKNNRSHLSLATVYVGEKTKGAVDYTLQVPSNLSLQLRTGNGTITVKGVNGKVIAQTTHGNIDIHETNGTVLAQTEHKGNITLDHINGDIKTVTANGKIDVVGATKSIIASTQKGNINTQMAKLENNTLLELNSNSGDITVGLPQSASARVTGHTDSGLLTSAHWIRLNPFTTQLDKNAWRQFRRSVEGTINAGEAEVKLTSASGNIKITETATA